MGKKGWYIAGIVFWLIILIIVILLLGKKNMEDDTSPTGYPEGEIQRQYVMVNGNSYIGIGGNKTTLPDGYILYGSIAAEHNVELPKNDLEGVHVSVGTEVYYNPDETEKVYCKFSDVYVCFELSK